MLSCCWACVQQMWGSAERPLCLSHQMDILQPWFSSLVTATALPHVFLSGDQVNCLHFGTENTSLQQETCLYVGRSKTSPCPAKRYFGDVNFCHTGGNQLSLCMCVVLCAQHQQSFPHQVSNEVAESCCLTKTDKWIMAINILFRTTWLTKTAEAGGLRCQQHKLFW